MFLQYTKYRDIDAVTCHDACHVTKSPRLSLRLAYRAGQRSYVKLLRGRREEPGNEANNSHPRVMHTQSYIHYL